ncbi:MAG: rhomboid family intramembrane serine protease, partial [Chloroflexota bacterium]
MSYEPQDPPRRRHPLEGGDPSDYPPQGPQRPQAPQERITLNMEEITPYATYILIAINVLVYIVGLATDATQQFFIYGAINGQLVFDGGDYYRMLTAMFLHGGAAHLFFNMYALYILGMSIEQMYGRWRFLAIYF